MIYRKISRDVDTGKVFVMSHPNNEHSFITMREILLFGVLNFSGPGCCLRYMICRI